MIALLQRVSEAAVLVNENLAVHAKAGKPSPGASTVARIGAGMLALIGVERGDGPRQVERLLQRMLAWRMFADKHGKMNLNIAQAAGGLLLVPQFTLAADTNSGNRPSFTPAATPAEGKRLFDLLADGARRQHALVEVGIFGADMKVSLINDGPVTFWLQVSSAS
jgi:D-tyrosyl-tRNA(Tyr) deacylase